MATAQIQTHLLPAPREAHFDGTTSLPARIDVSIPGHDADDEFAARDLLEAVKNSASAPAAKPGAAAAYRVVLLRSDSAAAKALLTKQKPRLRFRDAVGGFTCS